MVGMVNLLPLGTSDITIKYIVILLEKIVILAGMAARGSELCYNIFLLSSKHDKLYFDYSAEN